MKKKKNTKPEMKLIPQYSEKTREFIRIIEEARKEYEDKEFKTNYKTLLN